jgi:hypothetical protein
VKVQADEMACIEMLEAEEQQLLAEAQANQAGSRNDFLKDASDKETRVMEQFRMENVAKMGDKSKSEMEQRCREEWRLLEETTRLERMEIETVTNSTKKDWMLAQEQKRMAKMALLESEIKRLEQGHCAKEEECQNLSEERHAEEEASMIEQLEAEASSKARTAEEAIARAKAALSQVSSACRDIIAQTIAMSEAEAEAIAEAETFIRL